VQQRQPRKKKERTGLKQGEPLTNFGTCPHYKKSKRWLRFPCCNRLFPCDECHDQSTDHPAEWAKRMVCGYCSKEQRYKNEGDCESCGKDLTGTGRRSRFWEGGKGCRNPKLLSKNDTHKFKRSMSYFFVGFGFMEII